MSAIKHTPVTVNQGGDENPVPVKVVEADGDVVLSGDVIVDTLGALDDAAESDPDAASATIPALLRGILAELQAMSALLDDIKTNTGA